jgi:hypothetical protein
MTAIVQRTQFPIRMQRPWPLAEANGFVLVWESLAVTGVTSVPLPWDPRTRGFALSSVH